MNFSERLADFIGRSIEVFLINQFLEGTLISVEDGFFTLEVENPSYVTPSEEVTVFEDSVSYVRILAA